MGPILDQRIIQGLMASGHILPEHITHAQIANQEGLVLTNQQLLQHQQLLPSQGPRHVLNNPNTRLPFGQNIVHVVSSGEQANGRHQQQPPQQMTSPKASLPLPQQMIHESLQSQTGPVLPPPRHNSTVRMPSQVLTSPSSGSTLAMGRGLSQNAVASKKTDGVVCAVCGKPASFLCSGCAKTPYCSSQCQVGTKQYVVVYMGRKVSWKLWSLITKIMILIHDNFGV